MAGVILFAYALLDYLAVDMAHLVHERVRVLYLNTKNRLLLDHLVHDGTIDEASIHPREVIKRGLDIGASALILVHNHPSGNPEPSRADIQITHRIAEAVLLECKLRQAVVAAVVRREVAASNLQDMATAGACSALGEPAGGGHEEDLVPASARPGQLLTSDEAQLVPEYGSRRVDRLAAPLAFRGVCK